MMQRAALLFYLAAVVASTFVHDPRVLGAGVAAVLLIAGRRAWRVAKRAALAVLLFHAVVVLSYAAVSLVRGTPFAAYVVLVTTRVFFITSLTFLLAERVDLVRALSFSRTLSHVVTLAWSQILTFRRLFDDFRLALVSRTLERLGAKEIARHGASTGAWFLRKSVHTSAEVTQAMKSRGFFT